MRLGTQHCRIVVSRRFGIQGFFSARRMPTSEESLHLLFQRVILLGAMLVTSAFHASFTSFRLGS